MQQTSYSMKSRIVGPRKGKFLWKYSTRMKLVMALLTSQRGRVVAFLPTKSYPKQVEKRSKYFPPHLMGWLNITSRSQTAPSLQNQAILWPLLLGRGSFAVRHAGV